VEDVISRRAREALGDTTRRCTATNRAGERCGRAPIVGGFVCAMHGGAVPAVKKAAAERLHAMVDPALDAVLRAITVHGPPCEHCGRSDADRDPVVLRAAQMVLDRTGFHPTLTLSTQPVAAPPYFQWIPRERLDQITAWMAEAKSAMAEGEPRPGALPALDAELIDGGGEDGHLD
jgi:hypothetical protein